MKFKNECFLLLRPKDGNVGLREIKLKLKKNFPGKPGSSSKIGLLIVVSVKHTHTHTNFMIFFLCVFIYIYNIFFFLPGTKHISNTQPINQTCVQ